MPKLARFWRSLESVPGLAGVSAEWRSWLGSELNLIKGLLRPDGDLATAIPCPSKRPCACIHEIIEHSPDNIVAVCDCGCQAAPVTRADIVLYEVNVMALAAAVASALELKCAIVKVDGMYMTFRLGSYSPLAGFDFPVFLTMPLDPSDLQQVAATLIAESDGPIIVLTPTRDLRTPAIVDLANRKHCALLALSDFMVLGLFVFSPEVRSIGTNTFCTPGG